MRVSTAQNSSGLFVWALKVNLRGGGLPIAYAYKYSKYDKPYCNIEKLTPLPYGIELF